MHGHNYRVHFVCEVIKREGVPTDLDSVGRVIDFSVIKEKLCMWLETHFDHKFLVWIEDPLFNDLRHLDPTVVAMPFNPTAENIARHLVLIVAPEQLKGTGVQCTKVIVEETRKCSASYEVTR